MGGADGGLEAAIWAGGSQGGALVETKRVAVRKGNGCSQIASKKMNLDSRAKCGQRFTRQPLAQARRITGRVRYDTILHAATTVAILRYLATATACQQVHRYTPRCTEHTGTIGIPSFLNSELQKADELRVHNRKGVGNQNNRGGSGYIW